MFFLIRWYHWVAYYLLFDCSNSKQLGDKDSNPRPLGQVWTNNNFLNMSFSPWQYDQGRTN